MSRRIVLLAVIGTALIVSRYSKAGSIRGSSHDFSTGSPGRYTAEADTQICTFCHTPSHKGNPKSPLWNRKLSGATYNQLYSSSTLTATIGPVQAGDSTKLCLGCHDGTVALGDTVNNGRIPFRGGVTTLPATGRSNLGTNLSDDHPAAFTPTFSLLPAYPQVTRPPRGDAVKLDSSGRMQCVTCHDPHDETKDPTEKRFLVKMNSTSAICTTCHVLQSTAGAPVTWSWAGSGQISDHKTATNAYATITNNPGGTDSSFLGAHTGYNTTASNACAACHRSHTAHGVQRLLKGDTDQVCFQCHDGNATTAIAQNIKTAFSSKVYKHPGIGTTQTGHDPNETPLVSASRHGACDDCHNPHAAKGYTMVVPTPPNVSPALVGTSGLNATGTEINPRVGRGEAAYEYQICFKCHADSTNKPQTGTYTTYGTTPFRASFVEGQDQMNYNVRLQFQSTISPPARHPVTQAALGNVSPSLRTYMRNLSNTDNVTRLMGAGRFIYCADCHNNEENRQFGGTGPNGPHGSAQPHLLERNYSINTLAAGQGAGGMLNQLPHPPAYGTGGTYALCEKCHRISSTDGACGLDTSPLHQYHTTKDFGFSCSTCHSPHGVNRGTSYNRGMIDFDVTLVAPNIGSMYVVPTAVRTGSTVTCYLRCHGTAHGAGGKGASTLYGSGCAY